MNREQRRKYNKQHHTNYTKQDFEIAITLAKLKAGGQFTPDEYNGIKKFVHMDNTEIAPDGCEVMLNYEAIKQRPQEDLTDEFKQWIEDYKDKTLHLTREGVSNSLVSVQEDQRFVEEENGDVIQKPRWLFDLYSDLLIKQDGEFKSPLDIENAMDGYFDPAELVKDETDEGAEAPGDSGLSEDAE